MIGMRAQREPYRMFPTGDRETGRALVRQSNGCALRPHGFRALSVGRLTENVVTEERPESVAAFLVGLHRRNRIKFKGENDFHQKIPGRQTLTVTQIGRVRVRNVNSFREFLVSHSHVIQYVVCVTTRQRVGPMDHNLKLSPDMDQVITAHRERLIRARALDAAVAHSQTEVTAGEDPQSPTQILYLAEQFADYIRDGKVK